MVPPGQPTPPTHGPKGTTTSLPALQPQYGGVSAVPTSSSNASLASTNYGHGPLGRPLAIDDQGKLLAPGQLTSASRKDGWLPPNPNPQVVAVPDVAPAKFGPTTWENPAPKPPAPAEGAGSVKNAANDSEDLARVLQQSGVLQQKSDPVPEGVRLTCYLARTDGAGLRLLEATARDYPAAAQAILRQLQVLP